jgi:hypothetical protein
MQTDISTAQRDAIKAIATREGLIPSQVIRRAIDREIARSTQPTQRSEEIA